MSKRKDTAPQTNWHQKSQKFAGKGRPIILRYKSRPNSKQLMEELYTKYVACERDCETCDKFILDFTHHFNVHTSNDMPENITQKHSTPDYKSNKGIQKKMKRKRKDSDDVDVDPTCDLNLDYETETATLFLNEPQSERPVTKKCGRNLRARKRVNYAELTKNNLESKRITTDAKTKNVTDIENPNNNFVIIVEPIKSETKDEDQTEQLDYDDHLAELDADEDVDDRQGDEKDYEDEQHLQNSGDSGTRLKDTGTKIRQPCPHCSKKYHDLNTHLENKHGDRMEQPFVCIYCEDDVRFYSAVRLSRHVSTVHPGQKPFKCNICSKEFVEKWVMDNHAKKHNREKPFPCPVCTKRFRSNDSLDRHAIIHRVGKSFPCDYEQCNKSYYSAGGLKEHKKCHSPEKKLMCDQCSKYFYTKGTLNHHLLTHGDKSHVCEYCGRGFTLASHLARHSLIHTGEKPHQCHLCGRFFRLRQTLKFHLKCTHGIEHSSESK